MKNRVEYNIIVCGLYCTGSSAYIDLLREYSSVGCIPGEFDDFRRYGLLGDALSGDYPLENNIVKKYIKSNFLLYYPFFSSVSLKRRLRRELHALASIFGRATLSEMRGKKLYNLVKYCHEAGYPNALGACRQYIEWIARVYCGSYRHVVF